MKIHEITYDFSAMSDSAEEKCINVPLMLRDKVLKIFDRCHMLSKLIIWKDFENALMYEPFWLMRHRAKSVIEEARKVTTHKEFWNKERLTNYNEVKNQKEVD